MTAVPREVLAEMDAIAAASGIDAGQESARCAMTAVPREVLAEMDAIAAASGIDAGQESGR